MNSNITFVIFTYNEEARIEKAIKNFICYGKVLIADNKSVDKTCEIARSYGCDILIRQKHYVYVENQEMLDLIYNNISTDWIYWAYADEMLDKKTLDKIQSVILADKHEIINIDRKNFYYGKFCYDLYHVRMNRIFKKNAISFEGNSIHGFGKPTVKANKIYFLDDKYFVRHFISYTSSTWINANNKYTDSESPFKRKLSPILLLVYLVTRHFFMHFIKEKGYKVGFTGIAMMELMIFYQLTRSYKLYEKENGLDKNNIEKINNSFRDNLLIDINSKDNLSI